MSSGFDQMLLLKIPAKQDVIAEIPGNRCSFYEVQYMPGYFFRYLFSSNGITLCDTLTLLHILETTKTIDNSLDGDLKSV
jgi:hypothetical protein